MTMSVPGNAGSPSSIILRIGVGRLSQRLQFFVDRRPDVDTSSAADDAIDERERDECRKLTADQICAIGCHMYVTPHDEVLASARDLNSGCQSVKITFDRVDPARSQDFFRLVSPADLLLFVLLAIAHDK